MGAGITQSLNPFGVSAPGINVNPFLASSPSPFVNPHAAQPTQQIFQLLQVVPQHLQQLLQLTYVQQQQIQQLHQILQLIPSYVIQLQQHGPQFQQPFGQIGAGAGGAGFSPWSASSSIFGAQPGYVM